MILPHKPVVNLIFSCLTQLELVRVSRTCSKAHMAVAGYQEAAYSIDGFLSIFFTSISGARSFRSLQGRTGTLIGGVSALWFLNRSPDPLHVLEIYAFVQHLHEIGAWLCEAGYSYAPSSMQSEDYLATITDTDLLSDGSFSPPSVCGRIAFKKLLPDLTTVGVQVSFAMCNPMEIILHSCSSTYARTSHELSANSVDI